MIDTSKEHLASVLGQFLVALDDEEWQAERNLVQASERRRWAMGAEAEIRKQMIEKWLDWLFNILAKGQRPKRLNALIAELREAAGLDPNGEEWDRKIELGR